MKPVNLRASFIFREIISSISIYCIFFFSACHKEQDLTSEGPTITIDGWEITKGTNSLNIYGLFDMFFLDPQTGFVINYDGSIYKTTDSCKTWSVINPESNWATYSVWFLNAKNGFAAGQQLFSRTSDGGETWTTNVPPPYISINTIRFFDLNKGMAVIQKEPNSSFIVAITSDAGIHWTDLDFNVASENYHTRPLYVDNTLFVMGEAGKKKIYKSPDQGQTWDTVFAPTGLNSQSIIYFCSKKIGFYTDGLDVYKSLNGGLTWVKKDFPSTTIYSLHFFDEDNGFFIDSKYVREHGPIDRFLGSNFYTTRDGGESWRSSGLLKFYRFGALNFPEPGFGYAMIEDELYTIRKK